jgi:hypothetical protein
VLDDGQPVVAALGDEPPGGHDGGAGLDGDRVLGHEVGLGDDPHAAPALVDDREARQLVTAQEAHDGLDVVSRRDRDGSASMMSRTVRAIAGDGV